MSAFRVVEHKIPCQHLREYPRALAFEEEDVLYLAVKQYIPVDNPNPQRGDVTIIASHANAFPKELYEPLWDELIRRSQRHGFKIRNIWMADVAHQGESGVINEEKLGNDPAWFDHSRDLLHLINLKRNEMPRPIIGVGHSMGGAQLVNLSLFHPTLFTSLVLIDPVIQPMSAEGSGNAVGGPNIGQLSTFRRDVWPSREAAAAGFRKSPFYQTWDPRVLDLWVQHGLRDLPTPTHATTSPPQVTLKTTVAQEVYTFLRPNYNGHGAKGQPLNRKTHPDVNPEHPIVSPFYRYESPATLVRLPELRPSVFYIFASDSTTSHAEWNQLKVERTGTAYNGSGGAREGRVDSVTFEKVGHLIAMEAVDRTAQSSAVWIGAEMAKWREDRDERDRSWVRGPLSLRDKQDLDDRWRKAIGGEPSNRKKLSSSKL